MRNIKKGGGKNFGIPKKVIERVANGTLKMKDIDGKTRKKLLREFNRQPGMQGKSHRQIAQKLLK